jgi:hypothetical protein
MKDKRMPMIGEEFEWHGVKLLTVVCDANGCRYCYFNRHGDEAKCQGCHDHICEESRRVDGVCVKFRKVAS